MISALFMCYKLQEMFDMSRCQVNKKLFTAQHRHRYDDEAGAKHGQQGGGVTEHQDLQHVGHHYVSHPDEAHQHWVGHGDRLVKQE